MFVMAATDGIHGRKQGGNEKGFGLRNEGRELKYLRLQPAIIVDDGMPIDGHAFAA